MAGIPLAALAVQQPPSPLDQASKLVALSGGVQRVQSEQLQNQMTRQQLQDSQLFMQSLQKNNGDWDKALDDASRSGMSGQGFMQYGQQALAHRMAVSKLQTEQLDNQGKMFDRLDGHLQSFRNLSPEDQAAQWPQYRQEVSQLAPGLANSLPQSAPTKEQLDGFEAYLMGGKAFNAKELEGRKTTAEELKAQTGASEQQLRTKEFEAKQNPNSPLYAPSEAAVNMGTAPGAAQILAGKTQQAATTAAAEAKAKMPYEIALKKAEQTIQDGDPQAAGQLLVNGEVAPSQIISARKPEFAQKAFQAAHDLSGGKWNAQQAEGDFKVASSPQNVAFFGSARSLTEKGGTLDQLAAAARDIPENQFPIFNSFADAAKAATGSGPIAKYSALLVGIADDYSKVMGGGQGSDTSRNQAIQLVPAKASPQQKDAAIEGIRGAVNSQVTGRIGSNQVLKRMYGGNLGGAAYTPPAGAQTATGPNGHKINVDNGHWVDSQTGKPI